MAIDKARKEAMREELAGLFNKATASVIAEYRGITAQELSELRVELRKVNTEFKVIKNRIARKAVEGEASDSVALSSKLVGPIGIAYMYGDVAAGTKAMLEFQKSHEKFKVTAGVMEGKVLGPDDLQALSDLPSKEVLLARIIGTLVSPHRGLLHVLNGVGTNLVRVINAIKDTKS